MLYFDEQKQEKYVPYCIEPSLGADRVTLAFLCEAYDEEELENGEVRTVLRFHPMLAPVQIAILPLSKKLGEQAQEIAAKLQRHYNVEYDDRGSIGKRYRRQDEIGTPFCLTVDFETGETGTVTIRNRDTMDQDRVSLHELLNYFDEKFTY
jgi:glycyl-tRNA synthetase